MSSKASGIYQIVNLTTGMIYVGSAVNFHNRFYLHVHRLNCNKHDNKYLQNAWNKYGESTFKFQILEYIWHRELLTKHEQIWIDWTLCYQRDFGYNARKKAESNFGLKWSEETKKKMGLSNVGRKHTEEHKAKVIAALIGRPVSNETRAKMSQSQKGNCNSSGRKLSNEHKRKIGLANKKIRTGTKASDETKAKMSLAGMGRATSEETKKKISIAATKRYAIIVNQPPIII